MTLFVMKMSAQSAAYTYYPVEKEPKLQKS